LSSSFSGGPSSEALDEFDQVAALLAQKAPVSKPQNPLKTQAVCEANFALDSDEEEEARVELRGEFSGGSGPLENNVPGGPKGGKSEGGFGKGSVKMEVDDEELTLEAAVKPKARKKKKKLKVQGDE
jgi:hypothetical protein